MWGALICVALLVACAVVYFYRDGSAETGNASQAYFTIDDGKSWFPDDSTKLSPFTKDGKTAYRVFVWTCDKGKTKFVSHLQRYTEETKAQIEQSPGQNRPLLDPARLRA